MNLWLAIVAAGLAISTRSGFANPYLILGSVFLLGVGLRSTRQPGRRLFSKLSQKKTSPTAITLGGLRRPEKQPGVAGLLRYNYPLTIGGDG